MDQEPISGDMVTSVSDCHEHLVKMFQIQDSFSIANASHATEHDQNISKEGGNLDQSRTDGLKNGLSSEIKSDDIEIELNLFENSARGLLEDKDDFCRPSFVVKYSLGSTSEQSKPVEPVRSQSKKVLPCTYCSRTFKFKSQLIVHERIHTGEKPFSCPECEKCFTKKSNLNLHLKVHIKHRSRIQCSVCPMKFASSDYFAHMTTHTANVVEIAENFKQMKLLRSWSKADSNTENAQKHEQQQKQVKQKKIVCQYCEKTFRFQSALMRHVRVHTGEKPYKCDICSKAFGQAYFLRVHELTHWSVKRYNCKRCSKAFVHYSNAKHHACRPKSDDGQSWNLDKPDLTYTCHICRNVFDNLQLFKNHMKEHTGTQLYHCLKCDKLFGEFEEFTVHKRQCSQNSHLQADDTLNETLSVTQYNGFKRLSDYDIVSSLNVRTEKDEPEEEYKTPPLKNTLLPATVKPVRRLSHIVSCLNNLDNSSDPRKYFCPSCGRLFRHMGRLRSHMLTHRRGQSYTCTCCGKTLQNWRKLWLHQRVHRKRRGRFSCPLCGRGFRFVEGYKRHMSEHPNFHWVPLRSKKLRRRKIILPFECEQCKCKFTTKDLMLNHQQCHHKKHSFPQQSVKKLKAIPSVLNQVKRKACESSDQTPVTSLSTSMSSELLMGSQKPSSVCANNSTEGSSKCAICGQTYLAVFDLYLHYLQHARGELYKV